MDKNCQPGQPVGKFGYMSFVAKSLMASMATNMANNKATLLNKAMWA